MEMQMEKLKKILSLYLTFHCLQALTVSVIRTDNNNMTT